MGAIHSCQKEGLSHTVTIVFASLISNSQLFRSIFAPEAMRVNIFELTELLKGTDDVFEARKSLDSCIRSGGSTPDILADSARKFINESQKHTAKQQRAMRRVTEV